MKNRTKIKIMKEVYFFYYVLVWLACAPMMILTYPVHLWIGHTQKKMTSLKNKLKELEK